MIAFISFIFDAAGLESSDDEGAPSKQNMNGTKQTPGTASKGRLKRARDATEDAEKETQDTNVADIFGESDSEEEPQETQPADVGVEDNDDEPAKQKRKIDLFGDSDDEWDKLDSCIRTCLYGVFWTWQGITFWGTCPL